MSDKHLTESAWKALTGKHKLKDPKLGKALLELAKCDAANPDAQMTALNLVKKEAEALKKEQKANKEVNDYLGDMVKEVDKSYGAAELLKKNKEKEAAAKEAAAKEAAAKEAAAKEAAAKEAAAKEAAAKETAAKEEAAKDKTAEQKKSQKPDQDDGVDIKSSLNSEMRNVKARKPGDPEIDVLVCQMDKLFGVVLGAKVGSGQKILKKILKGTVHKFVKGTCQWGEGDIYTLDLASSLNGAATGLKKFFKEQAGANYKLRVGSGGVMEEDLADDEAPTADAAELFRKRFEALVPKIKAAVAAGNPKAKDITALAQGAATLGKKKDYVLANKALDDAAAMLSGAATPKAQAKPTVPPTGAPTLSTYVKAKRDWNAAKAAAQKNIAALKEAILKDCDPELQAPVTAKLGLWDGILAVMDDSVIPVIDEAIKEPDEERQAERNKSLTASFTEMLAALRQHPLISVADANPFGKYAIRAPLESVLTNLGAAFSH